MSNAAVDGKGNGKVQPTSITSALVQELFTDAFRAEVGRGKRWSRDALATATGFDVSSIGSWMNGEAVPTAWKMIRLMAVLGPGFSNRLLALAGQTGADWIEETVVGILDVTAATAALSARVIGDLADGQIDASEEAAQAVLVQQVHDLTGDYLARRRRQGGVKLAQRLRVVGG